MPTASAEEIFLLVKTTPVLFLLDKSLAKQGPATAETFGFLNKFVNISNFWKLKSNALDAYSTEIRKSPHSRSKEGIKNLAKLRGSQVGFNLAEAFEVVRKLID